MDVLAADLVVQYKERLLNRYTAAYPEHFSRLKKEGMIAFIDRGVELAQRHDISTERDVADFINLVLKTTGDFDLVLQKQPVREILEDENISGKFKVRLLYMELLDESIES